MSETVVKVVYQPDTASLSSAANEAGKVIETGIGKAAPNIKINVNSKAIDTASNAIQSIHDRMQMLPNISKTVSNQIARSFEKVGEAMNKLEAGKMSGDKFQKIFDNMVQYSNEAVIKAENAISGKTIKGPKVVVDEVDTKPAENAMMNAFVALGKVIGGKFMINMAKGMWNSISEVGSKVLDLKLQLQGMLGSIDGNAAFNFLSEMAARVPGDVADMVEAYRNLVNQGIYPTEKGFENLTTFAASQSKTVTHLSQAVTSASLGQFVMMKQYGVQMSKNGNKITASFRGQTTTINNTKQAITDYMASLGELPGMAELAEKRMGTLTGVQDKFRNSMNLIKFTVYEQLNKSLAPLFEKFNKIVDGIQKWVEKNPQLATTIAVVVMTTIALTGAIILLTGAIAVLQTVGAPLILIITGIMLAIGALVFIIWDLYNGLTEGESYILWITDAFLEWLGVSWSVQDGIDGITSAIQSMTDYLSGEAVPAWAENWGWMLDFHNEVMDEIAGYSGVTTDLIVALFNGNIPKASQGFANLAKGATSIFMKLAAQTYKLAKYIVDTITGAFSFLAEKTSGVPIVGDFFSSMKKKSEFKGKVLSLSMDYAESYAAENSYSSQAKKRREQNKNDNRYKKPGGNENKKDRKLSTGPGGIGAGNNKNGGGKGKGKGKDKGKGKGNGEDRNALDKATIIAIEGIEDVLKKLGYSLEKKIDQADLFLAQKNGLLKMMTSKDKTGIIDNYYQFKDKFGQGLIQNSNKDMTVNIYMNGSQVKTNKLNIKSNTSLEDLMNINRKVNGG